MNAEEAAERLAGEFRARAGVSTRPLGDLIDLVAAALHIDVIVLAAEESEHGLTMKDPATGTTVISVAVIDHPMRQRSSIMHEVGHVLASDVEHPTEVGNGRRTQAEIRADAFARHVLLPLAAAREAVAAHGGVADLSLLSDLVRDFGLSPCMAAIQLRTVGAIDPETCGQWSSMSAGTLAWKFGWRDKYKALVSASSTPRAPQRLLARAISGYQAGVLGLTEIADWYGAPIQDLTGELAGPEPTPHADEMLDDDVLPPGWAQE